MIILSESLSAVLVFLGVTCYVQGDLSPIVNVCCDQGSQYAQRNDRCDDYPRAVPGIRADDQAMCRLVLEVCCLKSKQSQMCDQGKADALASVGICAVRDDTVGAVTYKECCSCCQMGMMTQAQGLECSAPSIGNPCDLKFMECCTGITDSTGVDVSNTTDVSDIDECTVFGERQLCSQICINTYGSFRCDCNEGYTLAEDRRTCYRSNRNVDECALGLDNCRTNENCIDTEDGFVCRPRNVDANCRRGYVYDPVRGACVPVGRPNRNCPNGYAFNTVTLRCEDIDECTVNTHDCLGDHEMCHNNQGSFHCRCDDGFRRSRLTSLCEDIDECLRSMDTCTTDEICINTEGSYECQASDICETGLEVDSSTGECVDIDECARRMDTCTSSQRCENTVGSYVCRRITGCGTGYTLDEETQRCIDQNECEVGTHNCGTGYECVNTEGSFRCRVRRCPDGYRFSSTTNRCERISCAPGLRPDSASVCVDVDECTEGVADCRSYQTCQNTYGSYRCIDPVDCRPGYTVGTDGRTCVDIDECDTGDYECSEGARCINRQGSYECQCPTGYNNIAGICRDTNECLSGRPVCPYNSRCENTDGSFRCVCNPGLEQRGRQCVDIDECLVPNQCQHSCVNLVGSFTCTCNIGYRLTADERTCEDINECEQRGRVCAGECTNLPGSYRCTCPDGWRALGNGRSCRDINECLEGTDRCGASPDVMCFNTRGGYKCPMITCPSGFARSSLGPQRNSVRCRRLSFVCHEDDRECMNAPLSLSYNFLSFPENVKVPTDLFSMAGPHTQQKMFKWSLNVTSVNPGNADVRPATIRDFKLREGRRDAVVSLDNRVEGPQDIELLLTMQITDRYRTNFTGYAYSNIYLYVTSSKIG